jgi:hypothetical protein
LVVNGDENKLASELIGDERENVFKIANNVDEIVIGDEDGIVGGGLMDVKLYN